MYSPYSSSSQRNKSRLYLLVFLIFLGLILYWRYSSPNKSLKKGRFESAGEEVDSVIDDTKDKVNDAVKKTKDKMNNIVDNAKGKAKQVADNVEDAAHKIKNKI